MKRTAIIVVMLLAVFARGTAAQETASAQTVTVGAHINDVHAIDLRTHSYAMDFYMWFRWTDPDFDPGATVELMNTVDPEGHVETVVYPEPVPQPDGSYYYLIRHQGLFASKFPVRDYPFDHQTVRVVIEDVDAGVDDIRFVLDRAPLTVNPELTLPGYKIGTPYALVRDMPYPTDFGDLSDPGLVAYSRAEFVIPLNRPVSAGVFKTVVPVLLIVLAAAFALLLDPSHVEARIGLAITALLTLVAMQLTMQSALPEVAYLTLIDQLYLLSYAYVLVVIAVVVIATRLDATGTIRGRTLRVPALFAGGLRSAVAMTTIYLTGVCVIVVARFAFG